MSFVKTTTLHKAFFAQANKSPNNICLVDGKIKLSYRALERAIENLAYQLQQKGVKRESVISLYCNKRYEIIVAFFAISALGGCCVQLDKAFPRPFLKKILLETNTELLLCDQDFEAYIDFQLPTINITKAYCPPLNAKKINIDYPDINPTSPLWLVYSSGTTGKHKGISISHRAILASYNTRYAIKDYDSTSQVGCNIYYLWEVFRPLIRGGTVHIINDDILHNFTLLAETIEDHNINEFLFTPSYLETLLYFAPVLATRIFHQLQTCWLNGEVVSGALYHRLQPYLDHTEIYNLYSISECHDVAVYRLKKNDPVIENEAVIPVGFVLDGVQSVILDKSQNPCPPGTKGELYVYTLGLANEYINRPDLNNSRFISKDNSPIGKRLYKTGDYAKLSENNQLITIYGRCDYLVKLRGYTISLPFVEAILKDKLNVMHCIVKKEGTRLIDEKLIAYLEIPHHNQAEFKSQWQLDDHTDTSLTIFHAISPYLANYMLPQKFILVDSMAMNAYSNKLDRNSVDQLSPTHKYTQIAAIDTITSLSEYRTLWAVLLGMPEQDINNSDAFFTLGGTSLDAMMFLATMARMGYKNISITGFLQCNQLLESYRLFLKKQTPITQHNIQAKILGDIDTIIAQFPSKANASPQPKMQKRNILLTGATGFLGGYVLQQLLTTTDYRITCLIRSNSDKNAKQKLAAHVLKIGITPTLLNQRVNIITGDVSDNRLGLPQAQWKKLTLSITDIVNVAANVNLVVPYEMLSGACLNGVGTLISLALSEKVKPLYQVSTNGIFPANPRYMPYPENFTTDDYINELNSGYAQAKWAAEKLLQQAQEKGLAISIFRPGNICHIDNGYINSNDMNHLILQAIAHSQSIPEGLVLEMTPVNHIAKFITQVFIRQKTDMIYNMTNSRYLNTDMIAQYTGFRPIASEKWVEEITNTKLQCLISAHSNTWLNASATYRQENYTSDMVAFSMQPPIITENGLTILMSRTSQNQEEEECLISKR